MPLRYGLPSARNILKFSVLDMAFKLLTLHVGPVPYKTAYYGRDYDKNQDQVESYHLRLVTNEGYYQYSASGYNETLMPGLLESGYPGVTGGFRTFSKQIRIVGRSD